MRPALLAVAFALPFALPIPLFAQTSPWQLEPSETTADLRGVHADGGGVVWASGTGGTVLRSEDSGFEWQQCAVPPGAEKLDFRAIWGFDDQTAIVMSSGPGGQSRLYRTTDGCAHWALVFTNPEPNGFYDGLVFIDRQRGFLLGDPTTSSDPVEGGYDSFRIRATHDGGRTWAPVSDPERLAPGTNLQPLHEESFFAASNSSAAVQGDWIWLGTSHSRVLRLPLSKAPFEAGYCAGAVDPISLSCGIPWLGWQSADAPIAHGNQTSGIFSAFFRDARHGVVVGGDYARPETRTGTAAWSSDGGQHWTASTTPPGGYRSAIAFDPQARIWIAGGPNGSDSSRDNGRTWQPLEHAPPGLPKGGEWNALSLPWAVGPHGRIGKLNGNALGGMPSGAGHTSVPAKATAH